MEVVLISEELFKENSPVKEDTIISKFVPYIDLAQRIYIKKILGRQLLSELQGQIEQAQKTPDADPYPITEHNQALLVMIAPALSFYAVYQGLPFHWASIVNKGLTLRESENSKAVDIKDLSQLRRWMKDDAEEFGRQLIEYLCECQIDYPLWDPRGYCGGGCGCGTDRSELFDPLDAGLYIPKRR